MAELLQGWKQHYCAEPTVDEVRQGNGAHGLEPRTCGGTLGSLIFLISPRPHRHHVQVTFNRQRLP